MNQNNQTLYYQKAKEFLWLWEEIGSKREAKYWMTCKWDKRLEKAREQAIKEGWSISYEGIYPKGRF